MGPERVEMLLLVAAIVAIIARRLHLPYTVGLVVAGIAIAFLPIGPTITLTKSLVFTSFLPPLIFEAALYIPWGALRRDLPVALTLATLGVMISACVTAAGMVYVVGWAWAPALVFGVLIAATDPISVIALFRELGVRGRLKLLVEADSLFNDGTAAVAFGVVTVIAIGGSVHGAGIVQQFAVSVFGGIICGLIVAGATLLLAGRTEDHLVEITFTTVAAYGSFMLAEHFGASGVLAVLTAGLMVGNLGPLGPISARGQEAVKSFWDYFAFVVNSLVFLLIGMREAHIDLAAVLVPAAVAIAFVLLGRAAGVYACCGLFARTDLAVPATTQHILFWGGLRGALALALVLGLPESMPQRAAITTIAFTVVAFSVIIQGLTMRPFLRWLGVCAPGDDPDE